jgi:preprotein translocase subunit SecY
MTALMSSLSGGKSALDSFMGLGGGTGASALASTNPDWLADSFGAGISWFHIGIGPFISASIAMSVLVALMPELQALRKDEMGQNTLKWWTRLLTFAISVVQSVVEATKLKAFSLIGTGFEYYFLVIPMFVSGALAITWVADEITDHGLGQGSSVIITMSICGGYFSALKALLPKMLADFSLVGVLPAVAFFAALMLGTVLLEQGVAKVPLQYFQGPSGTRGLPKLFKTEDGGGDHIPFKINPTNMQPVIFAMFLISGLQWLPFGFAWLKTQSVGYFVLLFTLVFCGTYIDLQNTPQDISEYIMKIGARVPGVRPGTQTIEYFRRVQAGSRFFGGILLATIATTCSLCDLWIAQIAGQAFGLTSMLIVVSTVTSVKRQIQAMSQMPKMDRVLRTM